MSMLRILPKKVKRAWHEFPTTTAISKQQKTAAHSKQQEMADMNRPSFMDRQHAVTKVHPWMQFLL